MQVRRAGRYTPAVILTVSLFFLWGMANNLNDILIAHFRRTFTLTDFETSFVQQAFYIGYFCLAIPAAWVVRRHGYKAAIVVGLLLYGIGALLFYPAAHFGEYRFFLVALFVIASGLAFLETSANPLIAELGEPSGAARRLTLAQAANPLGTIAGVLIGKRFILSRLDAGSVPADPAALRAQVGAVQLPYLTIGMVVLAVAAIATVVRFPRRQVTGDAPSGGVRAALRHPRLRLAVLTQFCYVGAQVGLWSYTIRYAQANVPGMTEAAAADYLFASLVLFGIGRIAGSALMGYAAAALLLGVFAAISMALAVIASVVGGTAGLWALVATSLFMSIHFPSIFAIGLEGLDDDRQAGASLIVMAIIGGAVLTGLMGRVSDLAGIDMAILVPAACFAAVVAFACRVARQGGSGSGSSPAPS